MTNLKMLHSAVVTSSFVSKTSAFLFLQHFRKIQLFQIVIYSNRTFTRNRLLLPQSQKGKPIQNILEYEDFCAHILLSLKEPNKTVFNCLKKLSKIISPSSFIFISEKQINLTRKIRSIKIVKSWQIRRQIILLGLDLVSK